VKNCPITQEGMIFCGDPKNVEGLKFAGVDVANLANNHIENYGQKGVEETTNLLNGSSILATGISGPAFAYVRGLKFAFLGYNDISCQSQNISCSNDEKIAKEVVEAKTNSDIVIVAFHWGTEYTSQPTERQQKLAHLAIDSGADLIIGNHPHWIQPVENYGGKIITYAHGNFVFDQMWSQKTREGVVGKYTFYDKNLVDVEFLPVQIDDSGQPYFLEGKDKQRILDEMKQESIKLASNL
jgi:poly-gamma-glutamate synthesis protein (capsule biosynthesis protein)